MWGNKNKIKKRLFGKKKSQCSTAAHVQVTTRLLLSRFLSAASLLNTTTAAFSLQFLLHTPQIKVIPQTCFGASNKSNQAVCCCFFFLKCSSIYTVSLTACSSAPNL